MADVQLQATQAATGAAAGTAVMPGIGTVIGAGLGLLGGFLGRDSSKKQAEAQRAWEREVAQNTIQWRVADAQKAGIHPLYALGAPSIQAGNVMFEDPLPHAIAEAGQNIGRTISEQQTTRDKLVSALQLDLLQSQARRANAEAGIAELQEMASLSARNTQNGLGIHNETERVNDMGQVPAVRGTEVPGASEQGFYEVQPSKYTSGSVKAPGMEARGKEGMQEWRIRPGFYVTMPYSDEGFGEQLHEMSFREKLVMIRQNAEIYGQGYFKDAFDYFILGKAPEGKYESAIDRGWKPRKASGERGREIMRQFLGK